MKLTIGRIVHYYDELLEEFAPRGVGPYAAVVTFVHSDTVVDVEMFPTRMFGEEVLAVELMGGDRGQTRWWCWPPRAEEERKPRPTIAELEAILAADPDVAVDILPDGSVRAHDPDVPSNENVV